MSDDTRTSVLFVDDEVRILDGLRRQFRTFRKEWDMRFALSGAEAIDLLLEHPAEVVISDMRMPGMDGAQFLSYVRENWPATTRIVLSGQTDQHALLHAVGSIHQFIQKPCEPDDIRRAVVRARELALAVESPELRALTAGVESLPVSNDTYKRLDEVMAKESSDAEDIAEVVATDVGLSAKLLQLVNSAFFGMPQKVTTVRKAVGLLGVNRIKAIAVGSHIVDSIGSDETEANRIEELWRVSCDISAVAAREAEHAGASQEVQDAARLAGMLSLIGRALCIRLIPNTYEKTLTLARDEGVLLTDAEQTIFGVDQQTVGAYALGLWAFDDDIVECVARQRDPESATNDGGDDPIVMPEALRYVHMARCRDYPSVLADNLSHASPSLNEDQEPTQEAA